jgi:hypothetical protein
MQEQSRALLHAVRQYRQRELSLTTEEIHRRRELRAWARARVSRLLREAMDTVASQSLR